MTSLKNCQNGTFLPLHGVLINVWCIKNRTKLSSVLILGLVRFLMHQTLRNDEWDKWPFPWCLKNTFKLKRCFNVSHNFSYSHFHWIFQLIFRVALADTSWHQLKSNETLLLQKLLQNTVSMINFEAKTTCSQFYWQDSFECNQFLANFFVILYP